MNYKIPQVNPYSPHPKRWGDGDDDDDDDLGKKEEMLHCHHFQLRVCNLLRMQSGLG